MYARTRRIRHLRLTALALALCAWFALPGAAPARADDDSSEPMAMSLGRLTKQEDLERNQERTFTFSSQVHKQILIGALNLDQEDRSARRTAPRVTVSCPGTDGENSGDKIPAGGVSIVTSGMPSSAVFCTPRGAEGGTNQVVVTVTVKNTNSQDIDSYVMFAIQLASGTAITLPDTGDSLKDRYFDARHVAVYTMLEQQSIDETQFLLQYRGANPGARAYVFRDTDATAGCSATEWWDRSGSSASSAFSSCDLNNGDTTVNNNYLVVMNIKDTCIRYRAYLYPASSPSALATRSLNGGSCAAP